jgi:farnesyl-diphosphate farnesyltransferase
MKTLPWSLLDRVSRSFGLSLRLLPGRVREPIALAYLLARLSDTEADGARTPSEHELLSHRAGIEALLGGAPDADLIRAVWATIQEGQRFDLGRFANGTNTPLSASERDRYTYLVAGCVGEFWTDVCARHLPRFSRMPVGQLRQLGCRFGKALQLVNILRDRRADAANGRIYVAEEDVPATLAAARDHLTAATSYCQSLRPGRLRAACNLPRLLAAETLDLIAVSPDTPGLKVPRSRLWQLFVQAWLV